MSESNDVAGSDEVISLNYESQETFNEHSYRIKQSANRIEKTLPLTDQTKENQKPTEQVENEEANAMQTETQNYSFPIENNGVSAEQPSQLSNDAQNTLTSDNPVVIQVPLAQSTLTDESSVPSEKDVDLLPVKSPVHIEDTTAIDSISKTKLDSSASMLDASTTVNNLRLYISPSTSLLDTTNPDDTQPGPVHAVLTTIEGENQQPESTDKPKEEAMDISDAQVSLGSDGLIESHPNPNPEKSAKLPSPTSSKSSISPISKALYSLSQPTNDKFETILAKLTTPSARQVMPTVENTSQLGVIIREEEELMIKESVSKTVRRYAVKTDQNGRMISRELLAERVVEENTVTRIEPWPPSEKKTRRPLPKVTRLAEPARKKTTKVTPPERRTKSLKPTASVISPKKSKTVHSDDDDEVSKDTGDDDSSNDDDDDDKPTDNISGDEFTPTTPDAVGQSLSKGSRVFAKWVDGHFYPGVIGSISGEKFMIDFDDGAKRQVKSNEIISQSYLEADQNVMAQTQDGYFDRGTIKRIIKKKKTGKLGYVVEKDGKEKWYPLRFISLTTEQAEQLPIVNNQVEETKSAVQGKRKRTSIVSLSPKKKSKTSSSLSPKRSTFTPTRQTKLFNTMYFLLTGFNESMDLRQQVQDSIESHGGKVLEKIPNASRRENVYLITDKARKTAKFLDAKKSNIPCVNYKWIDQSVEKNELEDLDSYQLVLPDKETKTNEE